MFYFDLDDFDLDDFDLDDPPDAEFFEDLDDDEVRDVLEKAVRAEVAANEWGTAATEELVRRWRRRARPRPALHDRLRAAEQRRLLRQRSRKRSRKRRR
jgi:hypothetical protein